MTPRAIALLAGEKTYNGRPCKYGHPNPRYTISRICVECCRLRAMDAAPRNPIENRAKVAKWAKENPDRKRGNDRCYAHKRRAAISNATPKWLTPDQIEQMDSFIRSAPKGMDVDHMVPLNSKKVCGLHVPWNLQYLEKRINVRKSNKTWPNDWRE